MPARAARLFRLRPGARLQGLGSLRASTMGASNSLESTATLLSRVRAGDPAARERLCGEYLPILMRWAHGRLPLAARDLAETADLVQVTLIKALSAIDRFEPRHEGAFLAYLRAALLNVMRSEIHRSLGTGHRLPLDSVEAHQVSGDSLLAQAIGPDLLWDYERALAELSPEWREAIILRLEFGFSFDEVAAAMDRSSGNAARMLVHRAVAALSERLGPGGAAPQ
jgi:RNA polymerase sigma factor (sigma-70 family)